MPTEYRDTAASVHMQTVLTIVTPLWFSVETGSEIRGQGAGSRLPVPRATGSRAGDGDSSMVKAWDIERQEVLCATVHPRKQFTALLSA